MGKKKQIRKVMSKLQTVKRLSDWYDINVSKCPGDFREAWARLVNAVEQDDEELRKGKAMKWFGVGFKVLVRNDPLVVLEDIHELWDGALTIYHDLSGESQKALNHFGEVYARYQ